MQAIFVALVTSIGFTSFLSYLGLMGSCFEGSCGYTAILIAIPLTLVTFPFWRYFAQRWANGLRILVWLPIVFLVSVLLFNSQIIIVGLMLTVLVWFGLEAWHIRKQGMPWKALFIQPRPIKNVTLR
jgi:hypothetical protein